MIEIDILTGMRMINDGSVSLISTRRQERTNVAAITWQTPISQDPPMIGLSLTPSSRTNRFLEETGELVLSIPDSSLIAEIHYVGTHSGKSVDKVRLCQFGTVRARRVSPLLISNCIGHLECVVRERLPLGDHIFYVAEVITALVEQDYFDKGWNADSETVQHLGGSLYRTGGRVHDALDLPKPGMNPDGPQPSIFAPKRTEVLLELGSLPNEEPPPA